MASSRDSQSIRLKESAVRFGLGTRSVGLRSSMSICWRVSSSSVNASGGGPAGGSCGSVSPAGWSIGACEAGYMLTM